VAASPASSIAQPTPSGPPTLTVVPNISRVEPAAGTSPPVGPGASGARAALAAAGKGSPRTPSSTSAANSGGSGPSGGAGGGGAVAGAGGNAADGPQTEEGALKDRWMTAIETVSRMTKAMFSSGRFLSIDQATAVYALPNDMTLQRCTDRLADVIPSLRSLVGRDIALQLVVDSSTVGGTAPMPPEPTDVPGAAPGSGAGGASASGPASAARTAMKSPTTVASRQLPGPDDEIDLNDLTDVPETSPMETILSAFPGAEIVESP
jgi:hypothetical protein